MRLGSPGLPVGYPIGPGQGTVLPVNKVIVAIQGLSVSFFLTCQDILIECSLRLESERMPNGTFWIGWLCTRRHINRWCTDSG
jgi:hypothetical protein